MKRCAQYNILPLASFSRHRLTFDICCWVGHSRGHQRVSPVFLITDKRQLDDIIKNGGGHAGQFGHVQRVRLDWLQVAKQRITETQHRSVLEV